MDVKRHWVEEKGVGGGSGRRRRRAGRRRGGWEEEELVEGVGRGGGSKGEVEGEGEPWRGSFVLE